MTIISTPAIPGNTGICGTIEAPPEVLETPAEG